MYTYDMNISLTVYYTHSPHLTTLAFQHQHFQGPTMSFLVVLMGHHVVERWTRDRKVAGSTPGRGAIKSTKSTQPSIQPSL